MLSRLLLLIIFLGIAVTLVQLFRRTPRSELKNLYWKFGLGALAVALVILALTGRIHWIGAAIGAVLPFARQMIPSLMRHWPKFHSLYRQYRPTTKTEGDNNAHRSQVKTRLLWMTLDRSNNSLSGQVIAGPFSGQQLDQLDLAQLQQLLDYCHREERESARLLLSYLTQRFGAGWQQQNAGPPPTGKELDEASAYAILGLKRGASRKEIIDAHRRMMQKVHPDRGGSDYLAAQINLAKEFLLKRVA